MMCLSRSGKWILSIIGVCLSVWAILVFRHKNVETQSNCEVREETASINEPIMDGLLAANSKVKYFYGWYNCHNPSKGDLVLYRYSYKTEPIVRVVRAVEGDHFKLLPDSKRHAWNLLVNDEKVMAKEGAYFFGAETPPTLSLYVKSHGGTLRAGELILLSSVPPGSLDSGVLGIRQVRDVLAKVELVRH
jgi:hypothetical protein